MKTHFCFFPVLVVGFFYMLTPLLSCSLDITFWRVFTSTTGNLVSYGTAVLTSHLIHKQPFITSSYSSIYLLLQPLGNIFCQVKKPQQHRQNCLLP